ncbi:hypothetical protein ACHAWF_004404, partial [Thalassiosira exigua]
GRRGSAGGARDITPPRHDVRKRDNPDSEQIVELGGQLYIVKAQLESALSRIGGIEAEVKIKDSELIEVRLERGQLKEENAQLREHFSSLEQHKLVLCYDDLRPGDALAEYMKDFTFFPDFDCNDDFLELVNLADGCAPGMVSCEDQKESQEAQTGNESNDAGTGLAATIADANAEAEAEPKHRGQKRKLHWKT